MSRQLFDSLARFTPLLYKNITTSKGSVLMVEVAEEAKTSCRGLLQGIRGGMDHARRHSSQDRPGISMLLVQSIPQENVGTRLAMQKALKRIRGRKRNSVLL